MNLTMLFRHPGKHMQDGVSYDYVVVQDEDLDSKLAAGWSRSVPDAKAANDVPEPVSDALPSRAELEQKAGELGIKVDGRWSDKKLATLIADALKD